MNTLHEAIAERARTERMAEKWLVAPSLRTGYQWLDTVTRSGERLFNLRVVTLRQLAMEIAAPQLAKSRRRCIGELEQTLLVDSCWHDLRAAMSDATSESESRYLAKLEPRPSLAAGLARSVNAFRMSDGSAESLRPENFLAPAKAEEFERLVAAYARRLESESLCDLADVLRWATRRLHEDAFAIDDEVRILIPRDLHPIRLEQRFLDALPAARRDVLPVDDLPGATPSASSAGSVPDWTDARRLAWYRAAAAAPPARGDGTLQIFSAVGESNEVREVLRRCLGGEQPLDECEILYTDPDTYIPLLYEMSVRGELGEQEEARHGVPITFAEGIPVVYSRPGRALRAWLDWAFQQYPQQSLVRIVQAGLVSVQTGKQKLASATATAALRDLPIGKQHDRYTSVLRGKLEELRTATRNRPPGNDVDSEEAQARESRRVEGLQARIENLKKLQRWLRKLLAVTGPVPADDVELLRQAAEFVDSFAACRGQLDELSRVRLLEQIRRLQAWVESVEGELSFSFRDWLAALPGNLAVGGSGPRPGHLHAAAVHSGGHSGRSRLFVIGLDESRFPGSARQDPILLDDERAAVSSHLPLSHDQHEERLQAVSRLFARQRGTVTLGFSCHQIQDDREMFPSSLILAAHRLLTDNADADFSTLGQALDAPASFAPRTSEQSLCESDWWLATFARDFGDLPIADLVEERYANLAQGSLAEAARAGEEVTPFDGLVPEAGARFDPFEPTARAVSPSRLETVAQCPLRFFFKYVLGIAPLEEIDAFAEQWLNPLEFGSMMHRVYYLFVQRLVEEDRPPREEDWELLWRIAGEVIEDYRESVPPPNESAYRDRVRIIRRCCEVFLVEELKHCKQYAPRFLEASLGLESEEAGTPIDRTECVPIHFDADHILHARGRVDRIDEDRSQPGRFGIWDYKTGGFYRYEKNGPFFAGRMMQSVLYREMLDIVLRDAVGPDAAVDHFGYYFPNTKSMGQRLPWNSTELAAGRPLLKLLGQVIRSGAFVATTDHKKDCEYCDYQQVCQDTESVAAASRFKLEAGKCPEAEFFKQLRQ